MRSMTVMQIELMNSVHAVYWNSIGMHLAVLCLLKKMNILVNIVMNKFMVVISQWKEVSTAMSKEYWSSYH